MEPDETKVWTTLAVAYRAFIKRLNRSESRQGAESRYQLATPNDAIIIDCETTVDAAQQLNFGFFRWLHRDPGQPWRVQMEGCFHADDLAERMSEGHTRLKTYCARTTADSPPPRELVFLSHEAFLKRVFWPVAYELRGLVVGFNLPFDLTRLARHSGVGRAENAGAFSLMLGTYRDDETGEEREHRYLPRIIVRPIDSSKSFIHFAAAEGSTRYQYFRGRFLDLRSLVHTLTGRKVSLGKACELLGTVFRKRATHEHGTVTREYVEYARDDVRATQDLFEAALRLLETHPVTLDPCKAFSPASLVKAYFREMGITPLMRRFGNLPEWIHGAFMAAFYGGRAETTIRKMPMPVVHTDFKSMYPSVNVLMRLHEMLVADSMEYKDATEDVRSLCESFTLDDCFDPTFWTRLRVAAEIIPNDVVAPIRAQYDGLPGFNIGVNRLTTDAPIWITGPDLVALVLLSRRVPEIRRAVRLVPKGAVPDLKSVMIGGEIRCDPAKEDFFKLIVEQRIAMAKATNRPNDERERLDSALKIFANTGAYGIFIEANLPLVPPNEPERVLVFGHGTPFEHETTHFETPGPYFFPPMAALITAGARLMLALVERLVLDRGGALVFCDTDSAAIVATQSGGLLPCPGGQQRTVDGRDGVRALSWAEVRHEIVERFRALNPYDSAIFSQSILEIKDVNFDASGNQRDLWCYALAAKRYAFLVKTGRRSFDLIDASEHGLGHLLDPYSDEDTEAARDADTTRRWIREVWDYILRVALGSRVKLPWFARLPAVTKLAITSPLYWKPFDAREHGQSYAGRVKPCGFVISGHVRRHGHPVGVDATKFHVVQPYSRDPETWLAHDWFDVHTGESFRGTLDPVRTPHAVVLKTIGDVIAEYVDHPESKFTDANGTPCTAMTRGLLRRRWVIAESTGLYIGKEANRLEEVESQTVHDWNEVQLVILDPRRDPVTTTLLPALRRIALTRIAKHVGRSTRQVQDYRSGKVRPPAELLPALWQLVRDHEARAAVSANVTRKSRPRHVKRKRR